MSDEFTGLIPDTPEDRAKTVAESWSLDEVCFSGDAEETRLASIPEWMRHDDQMRQNSCAAHGGTNVLEKLTYLRDGKATQLSRSFLYAEGQKKAGIRGDSGCTLRGIVLAAREVGVCREDIEPYGAYRTRFSREAYEDAANWKLTATLKLDRGYQSWRAILGQNIGGILCASHWPIEVVNGYARRYRPTGRGGHAYAALFLAESTDANGRPDVLMLNSHRGNMTFKASATFVEELQGLDPFGNVGMTDMTTPTPRPADWSKDGYMLQ